MYNRYISNEDRAFHFPCSPGTPPCDCDAPGGQPSPRRLSDAPPSPSREEKQGFLSGILQRLKFSDLDTGDLLLLVILFLLFKDGEDEELLLILALLLIL